MFRCSTGDAEGDFTAVFTGFFICSFALDEKGLPEVGKVYIAVEHGCGPDFADFDPAVTRRIDEDKVRILAVLKIKRDVLKKSGLVVFNGEVVMRLALFYHIVGNLVLGQQGIGGDIFALNIDGIQKWYGGLDFVGTLNLLLGYGQCAYFFGV